MKNILHEQAELFLKMVQDSKSILLLRHIPPDGDCVGAQHALNAFLKLNFPHKIIHFVGSKIYNYLVDLFPKEFEKCKQLRKSYNLQIIVDTSTKSRIDGDFNLSNLLISIDHHTLEDIKGNLDIRYPKMSSACEIVARIFLYLKKAHNMKLNREIAKYLYIGITTDTKRMWYNVTSDLLLILSNLLEYGLDTNFINEAIYYWDVNEIRFRNALIDKAVMNGTCIHVILEPKDYLSYNLDYYTAKDLALLLVEIKTGMYFVIVVKNNETNEYHVSLRSKSKRIDRIATKYGGGGHQLASGVRLKDKETLLNLIEEIQKYSQ